MAARLSIVASGDDAYADRETLELALDGLREDLLDLDVDRVDRAVAGSAPAGSRAGVVEAIGSLLVGLTPAPMLLEGIITVVRSWLDRSGGRSAVLEYDGHRLEVTGVSRADQRHLADQWIAAVLAGAPGSEP